jgi:signal transduction histidine kinase
MRTSLSLRLKSIGTWKLVVASIVGAVLITDSVTSVISWLIWGQVPLGLLALGTLNAILVPIILAPILIRAVKKAANLEALNRQLQQEVAERQQAEAERERLIKELEAKNAELERFTYTVSHDLKSPLITVRGFVGLLEDDATEGNLERMKADMVRIYAATDKMQRLLDNLLELSRIGRLMDMPQQLPFAAIAHEAVELMRGRLGQRGVTVEIADGLPAVYGDRTRLVEVVQNLLDNAVKFMGGQSDPRITIGVRTGDGANAFFVQDNGIGIDPQFHDKIFGLFNQLDPSIDGTGIGLALVKRIVEVHGGRVWVESTLGQGATFFFTLPAGRSLAV